MTHAPVAVTELDWHRLTSMDPNTHTSRMTACGVSVSRSPQCGDRIAESRADAGIDCALCRRAVLASSLGTLR